MSDNSLLYWKENFSNFAAGTGRATVVCVGDSLMEGYFAGPYAHVADMWTTRCGLNLAARGGRVWASRYMPTHGLDGGGSDHGPWAEGDSYSPPYTITDPWTYTGSHAVRPGTGGLGERSTELNNGATISIPAPTWATHAQVHYRMASAGGACSMEIRSNNVVVGTDSGATVEQRQKEVVLQGSGNVLLITNTGSLTNVNIDGVTWQQRSIPATGIVPGNAASGSGGFGSAATVALDSVSVGQLMVLWCVVTDTPAPSAPGTPGGWTSRGSATIGTSGYRVCTRVKQAGDTSVMIGGGTFNGFTEAEMVSFSGANWGQISSAVTQASASSIDPPALTLSGTDSYSLVLVASRVSGTTFTFPTHWDTARQSNSWASAAIAQRTGVIGSTDPGVITLSQGPQDCATYHIELTNANASVTSTSAYVEVIEGAHGGYSAGSYVVGAGQAVHDGVTITSFNRQTVPQYPGARPLALDDPSNRWASALALLNPHLVIISLGPNDAQYDDTPADFTHNLTAMVNAIDAACAHPPDLLFFCMSYLDLSDFPEGPLFPSTAYAEPYWNTLADAMGALSASYGTRAKFVDFRTHPRWTPYLPYPGTHANPYPGGPNPLVSGDGLHPNKRGHNLIGDIIAEEIGEVVLSVVRGTFRAPSVAIRLAIRGTDDIWYDLTPISHDCTIKLAGHPIDITKEGDKGNVLLPSVFEGGEVTIKGYCNEALKSSVLDTLLSERPSIGLSVFDNEAQSNYGQFIFCPSGTTSGVTFIADVYMTGFTASVPHNGVVNFTMQLVIVDSGVMTVSPLTSLAANVYGQCAIHADSKVVFNADWLSDGTGVSYDTLIGSMK